MEGVHLEPASAEPRQRLVVHLDDGAATTAHVGRFEPARVSPRLVVLGPPRPLLECCTERGIADAIVGGGVVRSVSRGWVSGVPVKPVTQFAEKTHAFLPSGPGPPEAAKEGIAVGNERNSAF